MTKERLQLLLELLQEFLEKGIILNFPTETIVIYTKQVISWVQKKIQALTDKGYEE